MEDIMSVLTLVWRYLFIIFKWVIHNLNTIIGLFISGGLFIYFIQRAHEKKKERRLIAKMKKEISFDLFLAEMTLATYLGYLSRAKREHLTEPPISYNFDLLAIHSVLSSGLLFHFDSKFIEFIFDIISRIKVLELSYKAGLNRSLTRTRNYDPFIRTLLFKTVFAFNSIHKSVIYKDLKYEYLTERIIMERTDKIRVRRADVMTRAEVVSEWDESIKAAIKTR
jgi:hypothetical protein